MSDYFGIWQVKCGMWNLVCHEFKVGILYSIMKHNLPIQGPCVLQAFHIQTLIPGVQKTEIDSLLERPLQNFVKLSFHDNKVEREIALIIVSSWVYAKGEFVASFQRIERGTINYTIRSIASLSQCDFLPDIVYSPSELSCRWIEIGLYLLHSFLLGLQSNLQFFHFHFQFSNFLTQLSYMPWYTQLQVALQFSSLYLLCAAIVLHSTGHRCTRAHRQMILDVFTCECPMAVTRKSAG